MFFRDRAGRCFTDSHSSSEAIFCGRFAEAPRFPRLTGMDKRFTDFAKKYIESVWAHLYNGLEPESSRSDFQAEPAGYAAV
jgi:hypothetical protein